MKITNIGIVSPGDMGQAVAVRLAEKGYRVFTTLEGRSARTRDLAREAGIADCGSLDELVRRCDTILSILVPSAALTKAQEIAAAMQRAREMPLFVDCNAVSPQTAREIDHAITAAGGVFVDAGIIGPPPRGKARMRLYVSGPAAGRLTALEGPSIAVRVLSERIGDASGIKMCYAALTKGTMALAVELLIAARKLGVEQALEAEFGESLAQIYDWLIASMPRMPPKAHRWVPEMRQIAMTFAELGMTPKIHEGAVEMYEFVAGTALGRESPEQAREHKRDGAEIVRTLADSKQ